MTDFFTITFRLVSIWFSISLLAVILIALFDWGTRLHRRHVTMKLYSDSVYDEVAYDKKGKRWERFFGGDFYWFKCPCCGEVKSSGWVQPVSRDEVCAECTEVVYHTQAVGE